MSIEHTFEFDPTYGYTLEDLMAVRAPEIPADYEAFWREIYVTATARPLNLSKRQVKSASAAYDLYEIEYDSWDGVRAGAWMTVPKEREVSAAVVMGHGYGGREAPDYVTKYAVCIQPCARGFHRSAHPDIPDEASRHVLLGINSRESYVHLGCVVDYWLAATAILEIYPEFADRLYYDGGSFGGGMGALMLAWDKRFKAAYLNIPSFGNHPLRVTLPCVGSGQAVKEYYDAGHPEVLDVLKYFDAATAATFIDIPVLVAAATFDPSVPSPGQFCIYNSLAGPKELFIRQAAHFDLYGNHFDDAAVNCRKLRMFDM